MKEATSSAILFILTLPPPYHGSNIMNEILWNSEIQQHFHCLLLDISDHRSLQNIGHLDMKNISIAIKAAWKLIRIIKNEKTDLIYLPISQNKLAFLRDGLFLHLARRFSYRFPKPTILIHLHGARFRQFYEQAPFYFQFFIRSVLSSVEAAVVLSPALKNIFSPWVKKVYWVPNGLNISWPWSVENKIKDSEPKKPVITFLSNLLISKGILDFLDAISTVKAEHPEIKIKIAGEIWGKKGQRERKIIEARLNEALRLPEVEYLGPVSRDQKSDLFKETDIFVLPSYDEGQPLSLIEAMAAGCAIIATPVGTIPDMIKDGFNGLLVPPGQPQIMAEKILWLIRNPYFRKKISVEARQTYENHYTQDIFIARMIEVFNALLRGS